jgi:hypothetical protein
MQWPPTVSFPFNAGFVARERLPIRHYPCRDPVQLKRRCRLRSVMMSDPTHDKHSFIHWAQAWQTFITPDALPELKFWKSKTELELVHQINHLRRAHVRAVQRCIHAFCLPLLDRVRLRRADSEFPQIIPRAAAARLERELDVQKS